MAGSEDIFGGAAVLLGTVLLLWRSKRRFDRKNAAGIEQFSSFGGKLSARSWDAILWFLALTGLTSGVLFLAIEHASTWGWIVLLPVYAVVLLVMFISM